MARLRQQDLTALSRALELLYAGIDADQLSARSLDCIRSLFHCDFVSYSSVDLRQARLHSFILAPHVPDWPGMEVYQRYLREDPAAIHLMRTRDPSVVKMTDFVSLRQYRSTSVYNEVFRQTGCDRRLGFAMQNVGPISLAATLNRRGRNFSDEDRMLLNLLRPHLWQAHTQAYAQRLAQAERERLRDDLGRAFNIGLGEIDVDGRILWLTNYARTLLANFFPEGPRAAKRIPDALHRLLAGALRQRNAPNAAETGMRPGRWTWEVPGPDARALRVRFLAATEPGVWQILLEETDDAAAIRLLSQTLYLTLREAEAVHWLKQGKTNWEIAVILGIKPKTVGKHLEHIYTKLGVENRTAVVRVALEATRNG